MKDFLTLLIVLSLAGCSSPSKPATQQVLLVLPNGQFKVGDSTSDFPGALARLGPPETTQVNITACSNLSFSAVRKVKGDIEAAGYGHIGFAAVTPSNSALCANNSSKPKPLRGSA